MEGDIYWTPAAGKIASEPGGSRSAKRSRREAYSVESMPGVRQRSATSCTHTFMSCFAAQLVCSSL